MKTKLTFLLALTLLFLFSGPVYGGVFNKKDENGVFTCKAGNYLYAVNMNEKTITVYSLEGISLEIFKINEENEVSVKAISTEKVRQDLLEKGYGTNWIVLHKHSYMDKKTIDLYFNTSIRQICFVGEKEF